MGPISNVSTIVRFGLPLGGTKLDFKPRGNGQAEFIPVEKDTGQSIDGEKAALKKAAQGFESIFIRKLMSSMRSTMSENSMFGSGVAGEVYGDIVDSAVADVMSKKSILGLSDMLYKTMVQKLESTDNS